MLQVAHRVQRFAIVFASRLLFDRHERASLSSTIRNFVLRLAIYSQSSEDESETLQKMEQRLFATFPLVRFSSNGLFTVFSLDRLHNFQRSKRGSFLTRCARCLVRESRQNFFTHPTNTNAARTYNCVSCTQLRAFRDTRFDVHRICRIVLRSRTERVPSRVERFTTVLGK